PLPSVNSDEITSVTTVSDGSSSSDWFVMATYETQVLFTSHREAKRITVMSGACVLSSPATVQKVRIPFGVGRWRELWSDPAPIKVTGDQDWQGPLICFDFTKGLLGRYPMFALHEGLPQLLNLKTSPTEGLTLVDEGGIPAVSLKY